MISEIIGMTVKNDGKALQALVERHLRIDNFCHSGNYVFSALLKDDSVAVITTAPTGESEDEIRILSLHIHGT